MLRFMLLAASVFCLCGESGWSQSGRNATGDLAPRTNTPTQSIQVDPDLTKVHSLLDEGMVKQAEQTTRTYLRAHPDSADAHFLLGLILFKAVRAKESLAEYTEAAKFREPNPYDLEIVALDYVLLRDYMDADKWLSKSLERSPKNAEGWYYLGRTKYNENRFEEAVQAFQECLKLEPRNVKAQDNLGLSYAGAGRVDEASTAYRLAIAWQANQSDKDSGPFLDLGSLLLDQGKTDEAIKYLLEAKEMAPGDSRTHQELGKSYERSGRLAEAQAELEKAVDLSPQDSALHFVLGRIYQKQKLNDKAKAEFDRSSELSQEQASKDKGR
jgi:Flp pilus assembly protein TadD